MKKMLIAVVFSLMLSGCAGYMVAAEKPSDISAKPDKAKLVIVRDTAFASDSVFRIYIDGKLVGDTTGKSWITADVPPGPHYVVAVGGISSVSLINFLPGKTYSLQQNVSMGPWRAQPMHFWPMSFAETRELVRHCTYYEFTPGKGARDMDPESYKSAVDQYHSEIINNPDSYHALQEYHGF